MRALLLLFFGLLLPSFMVAFEFFTHMCRDGLFDPLPTAWDVLFCLSLPAATVALAFGCRCGPLCGFALAICAVYAAVLLPLTPFAFLAIAYFGLGLLPLCPLLGFLVLAWASQGQPGRGKGFALALVILAAVHSPVDRLLLELARTSTVGEDALRHHDLTPLVAMAAGRPSPRGVDVVSVLLSWLGPVPMGEARDVYFHVTGQPFSEVAGAETWVADHDMASDRIGTRRNGLILSRSEWKGQT